MIYFSADISPKELYLDFKADITDKIKIKVIYPPGRNVRSISARGPFDSLYIY